MESGRISTAEGFRLAHAEVFSDVGALAAELDGESALLATGCPGWTVRDHVAHIVDLESILIGRRRPDHSVPDGLTYIRNQPGAFMEIGVDARRGTPLPELVAEYRDVTAERLSRLAALEDSQLDEITPGFFNPGKVRSFLSIRVFDLWSHEQDIRRALGRPGGLDGVAAAHSRDYMLSAAGSRLQERLGPDAGTVLVFDVTGPGGAVRAITFDGERGRSNPTVPESSTSTLRLDLSALTVLTCGRADDPDVRDRVVVEGDQNLGRRVLEDLAVTP